ncbi:hypothetical protein [Aquimarina sp. SS2-1]|uniref:hypothetical protein n=1 Tax=Aquimarina besae TaxID=3342247 RepID=UPI00366FF642
MKFEQLLGKTIPAIEDRIGSSFKPSIVKFEDCSMYSNWDYFNSDFFGYTIRYLSLTTDDKGITSSISIHFPSVIAQPFYNSFTQEYGEPDTIKVVDKTTVVSEGKYVSENGDFVSNVKKRESDLRDGTFEEKPLFMIWEKDGFYIQAYLRHEMNISEIMFSIDSPPFNIKPTKKNKK